MRTQAVLTTYQSIFPFCLLLLLLIHIDINSCYKQTNLQIQDLETNDTSAFLDEAKYWSRSRGKTSEIYTICVSYIIGGTDVIGNATKQDGDYFQRVYTGLATHTMISFQISFYYIDSWDRNSDYIQINFDSTIFNSAKLVSTFKDIKSLCGVYNWGTIPNVLMLGRVAHSNPSLTLKIVSKLDENSNNECFGFRDITLNLLTNPSNTTEFACQPNNPNSLVPNLTAYCQCDQSHYWSSSLNSCKACHPLCSGCLGPGPGQCITCNSTIASFDGTKCVFCATGVTIVPENGVCRDMCNPSKVMSNYIPDADQICKKCDALSLGYSRKLDTGYQYQLALSPSSCDLLPSSVQQFITESAKANPLLESSSFVVDRTSAGQYLITLTLQESSLQETQLNVALYNLTASAPVPKIFVPSEFLKNVAKYTSEVRTSYTATLGSTVVGSLILHSTSIFMVPDQFPTICELLSIPEFGVPISGEAILLLHGAPNLELSAKSSKEFDPSS